MFLNLRTGALETCSRPRAALAGRVAVAAGALTAGSVLALGYGPGHPWQAMHGWLSSGSADTVLSLAALVLSAGAAALGNPWRHVRRYGADTFASRRERRHPIPVGRHTATSDLRAFVEANDILDDGRFSARACERALTTRLGARTRSPGDWPPHARAVAAALLAHAEAKRRDGSARGFALMVAREHAAGRMGSEAVMAEVDALLARHHDRLRECLSGHAYVNTALVALLVRARALGGPFTVSSLPWLADVDKPLWCALSDAERPSHHVDGLAAVMHQAAESKAGMALHPADLSMAVALVEDAVASKA